MSTDAATDLFLSLTPERVLDAVEAAGLQCNGLCYPLNSFENRVYEVELDDGTRIVSKFYRPGRWSREQILDEHRFLGDLDAAELSVCPTTAFPDGEKLKQIDNIYYCLFARRGGRAPEELTDELAERLGMLVGRMHNVGAASEAAHRIRLDAATYVHANLAWLDEHDTVPPHLKERYFAAARRVAEVADERMRGIEVHRVHGDLHLGNLLLRDEVFHVLDFDDMVVGPAVQDLWLALPGRDEWTRRQRETFIEGYEQFRRFDRASLRLVEPLRGMRVVHYSTWLARRWHDPIFPRTWPDFATPRYWDEETDELEDLVALMDREDGLAPAAAEEAEELTNKDFFWDWED